MEKESVGDPRPAAIARRSCFPMKRRGDSHALRGCPSPWFTSTRVPESLAESVHHPRIESHRCRERHSRRFVVSNTIRSNPLANSTPAIRSAARVTHHTVRPTTRICRASSVARDSSLIHRLEPAHLFAWIPAGSAALRLPWNPPPERISSLGIGTRRLVSELVSIARLTVAVLDELVQPLAGRDQSQDLTGGVT